MSRLCWSYIDDTVVYSNSWEDHLKHIRKVLQCLEVAGLRVKWQKCSFGCSKAHYLGHVIGQGQIEFDEKMTAVRDYPRPTTKQQVHAFLVIIDARWQSLWQSCLKRGRQIILIGLQNAAILSATSRKLYCKHQCWRYQILARNLYKLIPQNQWLVALS